MPTAVSRFSDIIDYIAHDSSLQAEKWAKKVLDAAKKLKRFTLLWVVAIDL